MDSVKKLAYIFFCFGLVFVFSACSLTGSSSETSSSSAVKQVGNFLKSADGGKNWENKIKLDETKNIGLTNVLSMAIDSFDTNTIYLGTETDGLFMTKDGGEKWEKLVFPLTKIYGLAVDSKNNQVVYASGVLNKRAKIFKSIDRGQNWTEIYTEPASESVISSLEISQKDPRVLYGGTSEGMIFKSTDSGQSWKNLTKTSGPVIKIAFDAANDEAVYFGISRGTIFKTLNGGEKIEEIQKSNTSSISKNSFFSFNTYSIEADPKVSGVLYVGTDAGIWKGTGFGEKWEEINILESSKKFPIRAIAINPQNSDEILYSNSGVIYKSIDNGKSWLTFQLNTDKTVNSIKYNPISPSIIYAGLRKI